MITINLLPVRQIKQKIRIRNEFFSLIVGLFILLIIIFFVGYNQSININRLQTKKTALQAEKAKYDAIIAKVNKLKKQQEILKNKLAVIEKLKVSSQLPVRVLAEIAKLTSSNRMWLKSLRMANNSINLAGIALDNATIAQYMEKIKASPFFSGAELQNSSMTKVANQKLKAFTLSLQRSHP
ncbi:MAG: PilN domain-containing protein [Deltaproteobacteria bacterium]|nr:PilN domain-containing protein [Deltaproteobacteria bacterium]